MQARFHRAGAAADDLGDFLDRHVFQESEREHPAVVDGQVAERAMDQLAKKLDMDPAEIRRKNFIPKEDFPAEVAIGIVYGLILLKLSSGL